MTDYERRAAAELAAADYFRAELTAALDGPPGDRDLVLIATYKAGAGFALQTAQVYATLANLDALRGELVARSEALEDRPHVRTLAGEILFTGSGEVAFATDPAELVVDIERTADGATLHPRLDLPVEPGTDTHLVGSPATGFWLRDDATLVLGALTEPLDGSRQRLLDLGVVEVPEADWARFTVTHLPGLRRKARVRSLDAEALARPCGPAEGPYAERSMMTLVLHINRELIHHGAEIACIRDLYTHTLHTRDKET